LGFRIQRQLFGFLEHLNQFLGSGLLFFHISLIIKKCPKRLNLTQLSLFQPFTLEISTTVLNQRVSDTVRIFRAENLTFSFVQLVWRNNLGKTPSNVINERLSFCCLQGTDER